MSTPQKQSFFCESLLSRIYVWFAGMTLLACSLLELCGLKGNWNLSLALIAGASIAAWLTWHEWKRWKLEEPERLAAELARLERKRQERMQEDIACDPVYARRVLECLDLSLPANATDEELAAAKKSRQTGDPGDSPVSR